MLKYNNIYLKQSLIKLVILLRRFKIIKYNNNKIKL